MNPGDVIKIKVDNRFRDGHVRQQGNELRGNAETMDMKTDYYFGDMQNQLNPPIVVNKELGDALEGYLRRNK